MWTKPAHLCLQNSFNFYLSRCENWLQISLSIQYCVNPSSSQLTTGYILLVVYGRRHNTECVALMLCFLPMDPDFPFAKFVKLWTESQIFIWPYIIFSNRTFILQVWLTSVNYFNDFTVLQDAVVNGKMPYPENTSYLPCLLHASSLLCFTIISIVEKIQCYWNIEKL